MFSKKYRLSYLPLFYDDLNEKVNYIAEKLKNPKAANDLLDKVESAIMERLPMAESFEEHEAFGRGKLLISLQFDKSVCNNQISLLLQNVFVWLLMRSGAFFARSHQPNKAIVDFNILVSLTVYDGSFSNFNAVNQFLNDFPVQLSTT